MIDLRSLRSQSTTSPNAPRIAPAGFSIFLRVFSFGGCCRAHFRCVCRLIILAGTCEEFGADWDELETNDGKHVDSEVRGCPLGPAKWYLLAFEITMCKLAYE